MRLEGRVAIVTGGSSGIGKEIAEIFAKEGARVVVVAGRNLSEAKKICKNIRSAGGDAISLTTDIADEAQVKQMIHGALAKYEKIDILVNSAGIIGSREPIDKIKVYDWDRVFEVDVKGTFLAIKHAVPSMITRRSGNIINLSSVAGFKASLISPPYSAAKGAIIALTKTLALAYASSGIRVNCISPGTIDTPIADDFFTKGRSETEKEEIKKKFISRHPLGRFGTAEEIARGALYLASDDSSFTTGINLVIDGGLSL
jgi:NAD(P)-dependent dehydrogenase (short-subunit alcohol dehydrogenase family)